MFSAPNDLEHIPHGLDKGCTFISAAVIIIFAQACNAKHFFADVSGERLKNCYTFTLISTTAVYRIEFAKTNKGLKLFLPFCGHVNCLETLSSGGGLIYAKYGHFAQNYKHLEFWHKHLANLFK